LHSVVNNINHLSKCTRDTLYFNAGGLHAPVSSFDRLLMQRGHFG
jgi:hypothetical protein